MIRCYIYILYYVLNRSTLINFYILNINYKWYIYNISKLIKFPMDSGMDPFKLWFSVIILLIFFF